MWSVPSSTGTSVRRGDCRTSATRGPAAQGDRAARGVETVPEHLDPVEHLRGALEELLLVEAGTAVGVEQLGHGVRRVLRLDAVVPGEEGEPQVGTLAVAVRVEARDELLPEAGGGPVLDG